MNIHQYIKVWDPWIRVFHWTLVASFSIAYLSGESSEDVHVVSGYVVAGLVIFRLIWGMVGSRYARFSNFIYRPKRVAAYLKELLRGRAKRYIGHNPAGGIMIIVLLFMLVLISYSGLKVYGLEGFGPLASSQDGMKAPKQVAVLSSHFDDEANDDDHGGLGNREDEDFWEEIHELASNFMLVLIVLHIMGVILSSRLHKENLILAMITGKKMI